jgi:hypothetical protein
MMRIGTVGISILIVIQSAAVHAFKVSEGGGSDGVVGYFGSFSLPSGRLSPNLNFRKTRCSRLRTMMCGHAARSVRLTSQSRPTVVELEHDLVLVLRSELK